MPFDTNERWITDWEKPRCLAVGARHGMCSAVVPRVGRLNPQLATQGYVDLGDIWDDATSCNIWGDTTSCNIWGDTTSCNIWGVTTSCNIWGDTSPVISETIQRPVISEALQRPVISEAIQRPVISEALQRPVILVLPQPRQNSETVSKTNEPFIHGDMHYFTNSVCKNVLNWPDTSLGCELYFLNKCFLL
jgi:hypothetical protein